MSFSNYVEDALVNHVFRGTAYTAPTTVYVALFTVAPGDDGTGGTECSGGSYARVGVTSNTSNWTAPAGTGAISNTAQISFTTATGSWGTIVHIGLYDASTSGNYLGGGTQSPSKTVTSGDTFRIAIGDLDITLT